MTHTHYILVDVTKELPTKSGWYYCSNKYGGHQIEYWNGNWWVVAMVSSITHWLKPCTETPGVLGKFIAAIRKEFPDQNWEYLDFIAERVLGDCTETGAVDEGKFAEYKKQFDQNFAKEDPKEFVKRMESLGYVFEDVLCIQFAEWTSENRWSFLPIINLWKNRGEYKTTSDLLSLYKLDKQKT